MLKDLKILFVLIFSSCFASLSLPLLTAGSSAFSLEFFIYENLKSPGLWPQALSLILFQSGFIFLICLWAFSQKSTDNFRFPYKKIYLLKEPFFLLIPFLALALSLSGLFFAFKGTALAKLWPLRALIFSSSLNSLILSLGAGLLTLLGLAMISFSFQNIWARKFIVSFMPPGVSFMGFAFLVWPFYGEAFVLMKWIFGLSLLVFPWIFRFQGERALEKLGPQADMARLMGAGGGLVFRQIIWPQCRSIFFLCAGMASFWACGDFSYSLIVSSGHWSLSLMVYDFFSSYRLDEALLLGWLLLLLSFFVFLFWLGLSLFFDKKFILKRELF